MATSSACVFRKVGTSSVPEIVERGLSGIFYNPVTVGKFGRKGGAIKNNINPLNLKQEAAGGLRRSGPAQIMRRSARFSLSD
jgi:hypothetical protein